MKKTMKLLTVAAVAVLAGLLAGCIIETVGVELVIRDTYCLDFAEFHETETFSTPDTLFLADELDKILEDHDITRAELVRAAMFSVTYQVTVAPVHDWDLTGSITVERLDIGGAPVAAVNYTSQSLFGAIPDPVFGDLNEAGVNLVNDAVDDYINGAEPVLLFKVVNGDCDPSPSEADPLDFEWEACVYFYAVIMDSLDVPDPFPG